MIAIPIITPRRVILGIRISCLRAIAGKSHLWSRLYSRGVTWVRILVSDALDASGIFTRYTPGSGTSVPSPLHADRLTSSNAPLAAARVSAQIHFQCLFQRVVEVL